MALSRMTDRVGQVLSERYRLLAPIGTGASASVYLADDVTLRRRVAVKILHDSLAGDEVFLRRFRAEAQAAAALNHPHIMSVFDWGHDDVPFLVTEYLGGGSLRTVLDGGRWLTPAQALVVGLEASRGLDYAHRRGFVHRDIKPANLLFDEEARLRIADFGLARALAEAAWTEPHGAVLGTARYASPEQARGETLDGRSDVYSLALAMVEAVTGSVPFAADTTIGTLMARVDRPIPVPESLGPLRGPLEVAGATSPSERPDAAGFARLLMDAAHDMDRPGPLILAGAVVHDRDIVVDRDPTMMDASRDVDSEAAADRGGEHPRDVRERPRRRVLRRLAMVLAVVGLATGAGAFWYYQVRVPTFGVPNLVGTNTSALGGRIAGTGWALQTTSQYRDGTTPGDILGQDPAPAAQLARRATLHLIVSLGPTPVTIPPGLAGRPLADVSKDLVAAGLAVGAITRQHDETVPPDSVISLARGVGPQAPKGSGVALLVSDGPQPRVIPAGLVGLTQDQATAKLKDLRLAATVTPQPSETVPSGQVMEVKPAEGTQVQRDSAVELVVSSGFPMVSVPDVSRRSVTDAANALQQVGLVVSGTQGNPLGTVRGTNPQAGTSVRKGTAILLIIG